MHGANSAAAKRARISQNPARMLRPPTRQRATVALGEEDGRSVKKIRSAASIVARTCGADRALRSRFPHHAANALPDRARHHFPAELSGHIFFVLSGYVFGESLKRDGRFWPFIKRRCFRFYQ